MYFNSRSSRYTPQWRLSLPHYTSLLFTLLSSFSSARDNFLRWIQLLSRCADLITKSTTKRRSNKREVEKWKSFQTWSNRRIVTLHLLPRLFHLESLREKIRSIEISNFQRSNLLENSRRSEKGEIRLRNEIQNKTFSKLNKYIYIYYI